MLQFLKRNKLIILGSILGAIAGYFYWLYIGCSTNSCPITASPINSSIWGGILGGFLFSSFKKYKQNK
ncbi:MAG TPA: hypothetical protein DCF91_08845 [Porphyromonadaceae bacterium]|nr:hypothetical protein [Porphyromonadaceae bacterium]